MMLETLMFDLVDQRSSSSSPCAKPGVFLHGLQAKNGFYVFEWLKKHTQKRIALSDMRLGVSIKLI